MGPIKTTPAGLVTGIAAGLGFGAVTYKRAIAAERAIEIISEASRHLAEPLKASEPDAPWREIASIGNVLRHAYDGVDDSVIWTVATEHLTPLRGAVLALINEAKAGSAQG